MKKVTLIGDCQTARIYEHWNPADCPVEFQAWGRGGTNSWSANPSEMAKTNEISSGTEKGNNFYKGGNDQNDLKIHFNKIVDQDLILVWLGYVDVRQLLGKHKDADITVKQMVERFTNYFKGSEIRFIEPLPQFKDMLMKFDELHDMFTYEERIEQNKEFVNALKKYSEEYGLKQPITQEQICNAVGLTPDEFTSDKTPIYAPHPLDTLDTPYMKKIYDLFIFEASK